MQYIGARYTPKFMGLYDNAQNYENLCVVDNGSGTTYISKKLVPADTPLTDTDYWAVYGASSGAIIALQNDVIALQNDVSNIVDTAKRFAIDVTTLGVDNEGNVDNATLLDTIFNDSDYAGATFFFPAGTYNIGSMVTINNGCSLILDEKAIIKAVASMTCMFAFNTIDIGAEYVTDQYYKNSHRYIIGGIFDAQHLANNCIGIRQFFDTKIANVTFYNIECGINGVDDNGTESTAAAAELLIENCRFQNVSAYTQQSVAIYVNNDVVIDNCFGYNVSTFVKCESSGNVGSNLHCWTDSETLCNLSKMLDVKAGVNRFSNIYCDNMACLVYWTGNSYVVIDNIEYLNNLSTVYPNAIFDGAGTGTGIVSQLLIRSDLDITLDGAYYIQSLNEFVSRNNNCLPRQPYFDRTPWNAFTISQALTTLHYCPSGFYAANSPLYRPTGTGYGYVFSKQFTSGNNFLMYFDLNTQKMYWKFGQSTDNWFDTSSGSSVAPVT